MYFLTGTLMKDEDLLEFAKLGTYCQFDLFGTECSYYQLHAPIDMPSDAQRIDKLKVLRDDGKLEKILMSHDIHTKHRLVCIQKYTFFPANNYSKSIHGTIVYLKMNFGGHGFSHIFNNGKKFIFFIYFIN